MLQSLTGLSRKEFEVLEISFSQAWSAFVEETFKTKKRKRAYGAGRKANLRNREDKLIFILFYFRVYPTQEVQGYLFGMGQAQANEWIHRLSKILNLALGYEKQLPEREPAKLAETLKACQGLEFMIDGTERPINRPKNRQERKKYYSGKKNAIQLLTI